MLDRSGLVSLIVACEVVCNYVKWGCLLGMWCGRVRDEGLKAGG